MGQIIQTGKNQVNGSGRININLTDGVQNPVSKSSEEEKEQFSRTQKNSLIDLKRNALEKPEHFSDQPFGALKDGSLWRIPGIKTTHYQNGDKVADLGNGISRIDRQNGSSTITGLKINNTPIVQNTHGKNENWLLDPAKTSRSMEEDAYSNLRLGPIQRGEFNFNGAKVSYRQFHPGPNGVQLSRLEFPDGRTIHLYSDKELSTDSLQNIAKIVQEDPPQTFKNVNGIFIKDQVGEVRGPDGAIRKAGGFYDPASKNIFLRAEDIETPRGAQFVLDHEAGHSIDFASNPFRSDFYKTADGEKLFGNGTLIKNSSGGIDLSKSDYVSEYASRVNSEDWAETHRFTFKIRQNFKNIKPTQEFFSLPAEEMNRYLDHYGVSPGIKNKIRAVADYYRRFYLTQPTTPELPLSQITSFSEKTFLLRR
jgi:hypothetical protein